MGATSRLRDIAAASSTVDHHFVLAFTINDTCVNIHISMGPHGLGPTGPHGPTLSEKDWGTPLTYFFWIILMSVYVCIYSKLKAE